MRQTIAHISLVVEDYDAAIGFYCDKLNFDLLHCLQNNTYHNK